MGRMYRRRLTSETHYQASILLYNLKQSIKPDYVTWEVTDEHLAILELFIVHNANAHEIARKEVAFSKRGKPMSSDMIAIWINRYLPFIEYDKVPTYGRNNHRLSDKEDMRKFDKLKRSIPKTPCAICGATENLELDHIKTYYEGGKTVEENLQWLCEDCHRKKTNGETQKFGWHLHSPKYLKHIAKLEGTA